MHTRYIANLGFDLRLPGPSWAEALKYYSLPVLSCSVMSDSLQTPRTVVCQAPLSMGFSRQEYWSGLPFPPPGDPPHPGIEPLSPESSALAGSFFTTEPPGKSYYLILPLKWLTAIKVTQALFLRNWGCKILRKKTNIVRLFTIW